MDNNMDMRIMDRYRLRDMNRNRSEREGGGCPAKRSASTWRRV
jgi:hypothetical protein